MADPDPWLPPNEWKSVRFSRFINILDDDRNVLSPTKINVWAANLAAFSTMAASIIGWISGHVTGMETMIGGAIGWLTQAHTTNHFSKKEKNRADLDAAKAGFNDPPHS